MGSHRGYCHSHMDQIDRVKPAPPVVVVTTPTLPISTDLNFFWGDFPPRIEVKQPQPTEDAQHHQKEIKKEVKAEGNSIPLDHTITNSLGMLTESPYRDKYIQAKRQLNACQQKLREATQAVAELTTSNDKLNEQLTEAMTSSDMYEGMYEDLELLRERMDVIKLSEYLYNQDTSVIAKRLGMTYTDYTEKYNKVRAIRNQLCHPTPQDYTTAEVLEMMAYL